MRRLDISVSLAVLAIVLVSSSFAQQTSTITVPNLIRYGGTLKDAQSAPLASSTVGVTFAIYSQQEGSAAIWMETQNVTTDAGGNYSVLLGSTTATGLPGDLFSQQEQRWLGVQVEGQAEQPRVMMVSVPYAFKAHEAETLAGRSVSDFVLAAGASSTSGGGTGGQATPAVGAGSGSNGSASNGAPPPPDGPTNFSGSTTDQIVAVTQSSTGAGLVASAPTLGIKGMATDPSATAYGVQGVAIGTAGVGLIGTASSMTGFTYGLRGTSSSMSGTGVRGVANAMSGSTIGVSGYVSSATGTAGVFNNAAGGNILVGQNSGATKFTVNGSGNVNAAGGFTGSGTGITGITFSQLTGQLASSQFTGTYSGAVTLSNPGNSFSGSSFTGGTFTGSGSGLTGIPFANLSGTLGNAQFTGTYANAVTLSNSSNSFTGNGMGLTGVKPAAGSSNYIQNTMTQQMGMASFNINGSGILSGTLVANAGVSAMLTTGTGAAVSGTATVTSGTVYGVSGQTASPGGTAVYGTNMAMSGNAYGVVGKSLSNTGVGVYGWASSMSGNDSGVVGQTDSTTDFASGVFGVATSLNGGQTYGVVGSTNSTAQNASGVYGNTGNSTSGPVNGVFGVTNSSDGNADGVYGLAINGSAEGVVGVARGATGTGVWGKANSTTGANYGVYGQSASSTGYGVYGNATSTATGFSVGVYGQSANGDALHGLTTAVNGSGVAGFSNSNGTGNTNGVAGINMATSGNSVGVYGETASPDGVGGLFENTAGGLILLGRVVQSTNLFTVDGSGNGFFAGNLNVSGTLTKGGGSFKIDDPIDPANKTLSHSFVESPDMMNIYNGIARLDARGEAWVEMPEYFEALNRDFRYQLTSVGAPQPHLYIAREVEGNRFKIAGGKAGVKVSWQVTGIRQDVWANAHRIPNEEDKQDKRGTYLYPELYGAAADKQTNAKLQH
jgi:hypothetical protein